MRPMAISAIFELSQVVSLDAPVAAQALGGNGRIQSSAADMERFYRGLSGRAPGISHAVVEKMITPHERLEGDAWEG